MDVHCSSCYEPWDVSHLWHEAIHETGLPEAEVQAWCSLPRAQKLSTRYREAFAAAGWEFGQGVINVVRCPCCPKDAMPDPERLQTKAALEELLGDDEYGLAVTLQEYRL